MTEEKITKPVIKINNLHYKFPESSKKVLSGINLEVNENEITTIVGRVGSGKSTLLHHMNRLIKTKNGKISINGKDINTYSDNIHAEVGLLFENPDEQIFYPVVSDDIAFGPRNMKLNRQIIHQRVIEASKAMDILHLLERETISLSYGEKTLVALAGLLATKPKILLMDSPTFGLDLWNKSKVFNLLNKLKRNHTIVISTNSEDILKISDKIYLLWNGKIRGEYKSFRTFRSAMVRQQRT